MNLQSYTLKLRMPVLFLLVSALTLSSPAFAGEGKLIATAGTSQFEGSAGGGIVPWAVLAGYDSRDEVSASVFATKVSVDDYRLSAYGAALSFYDRLELSAAQHTFDIRANGAEIEQKVYGAKVRLYGDAIYSKWPQISAGVLHKTLEDGAIAAAVGARDNDSGNDFYIAMTKVELGAIGGYNFLWNITARRTRANQAGLLGFGGDDNSSYDVVLEGSIALLLSRNLAIGMDYRQKPDNLTAFEEDDWVDVFVAWFPSKNFNFTAAWADLGSIAGQDDQQGLYFSLTGYLW